MISVKRFVVISVMCIIAVSMVMGQNTNTNNREELSVEESYLQESVETMIIREQSRADSRDMKLVALEYINDAIGRGNSGEEVRNALEYLALEGVMNKARESGRLVNNYPDVRAKAAASLGNLGTPEAKNTLVKMVMADPEPMVLTEAVKSLAKIGINDNDEVVNVISWVVTRFDVLNPDNLLALSALEAYETLASKSGGIKDPSAVRTIIRIAEGPYIKPVQERAKQVLALLRKSNNNQNNSGSNTNSNPR